MGLQLILGRAGTGKSQHIMAQITARILQEPATKMILLVPEQATFNFEYALATDPRLRGLLSVQVLSFQRLAWTIMQETGGIARPVINELGKLMLLRQHILAAAPQLTLLNSAVDKPGYINSIATTIAQLKRCGLSAEDLAHILEQQALPQSLLSHKLVELGDVYERYSQHLADTAMDSEDALQLLAEKIPLSNTLAETAIFIDEFNSFTGQELAIMAQLLLHAPEITVALTVSPAEIHAAGQQNVFFSTHKTLTQLTQMAATLGVPQAPPIILTQAYRFRHAPDLAYIERSYFATEPEQASMDVSQLTIVQAQNQQSEVDWVAREIRRLCREEGYHYCDIGIFARNFASYDLLLETAFLDYEIPFFLDSKRTVIQHPLLELILSALEIIRSNWGYQAVFRYLKTDLTMIDRTAVDELENYVLAHGLRGNRWTSPDDWSYAVKNTLDDALGTPEDAVLARINATRRLVIAPLVILADELAQADTIQGMVVALYHLLELLEVPVTLKQWAEAAVALGELTLAQTHQQIWNNVMDIFDQIVEIMQDQPLTVPELATLLETGFGNMDLGMIPSGLDQVFIGALQRSRNHQLKIVFILGVNEGIFPAKPVSEGLFNDFEKALLVTLGIQLAATTREQLYDEEFLIYTALTRAENHLYLSYALGDAKGKGMKPSGIIHRLHELFPHLTELYTQWPPTHDDPQLLTYISHPSKALGLLGAHLNQPMASANDDIWREIYNWLLKSPAQHPLERCLRSLFHQNQPEPLSLDGVKALYHTPLRLSVSSIEKYQQCPYSHFLTYGLKLTERQIYQLESLDIGQFYHKAMENFNGYLVDHQLQWGELDTAKINQITVHIVEELAPQLQHDILLSSGRYYYIKGKLTKTLARSAGVLAEHSRHGLFEATGIELRFGPDGQLPGIRMTLADGTLLELIGRIDRIEQACAEHACYVRIIDFKTGTKGLSLLEIFYGLKIQLLTYLEVVLKYYGTKKSPAPDVLPAGVLYYFFKDPMISADGPLDDATIEEQILAEMTPKGLINADLQAISLADTQLTGGKSKLLPFTLKKSAEAYLSGDRPLAELTDPLELFDSRSAAVVTPAQLDLLRAHVMRTIKATSEAILQGIIAIKPCKIKDFIGCQYCNYQAICQFDSTLPDNHFQLMADLEPAAIWLRLGEEIAHYG